MSMPLGLAATGHMALARAARAYEVMCQDSRMQTEQEDLDDLRELLAWINTHDRGCTPTGVLMNDGRISIRSLDSAGTEYVDHVQTLGEARAVLGY